MLYFRTKNPNLGKFWWVLQWKRLVYVVNAPTFSVWTSDGQSCPAAILKYIVQLSTWLGCGHMFLVIVVYWEYMFDCCLHFLAELTLCRYGERGTLLVSGCLGTVGQVL
jgi:hypothetical protein